MKAPKQQPTRLARTTGGSRSAAAAATREPFHWRSAISWKDRERIVCHGYDINQLADKISLVDMVFLLFQGELPSPQQEQMLTHIMVVFVEHAFSPSTVAARMTAAGRPPLTSAIAAGVLAFGDAHGPGLAYGDMMTRCLTDARARGITLKVAATELVDAHLAAGTRVFGLHQPQHGKDPRCDDIIRKSHRLGVAGNFLALQDEICKAYNRRRPDRKLDRNLLGAAGAILLDLGFAPPATWAIGVLSRAFSCAAHSIEEMTAESAWRASSRDAMVNILDLSIQGRKHYSGKADRPVPTRAQRARTPAKAPPKTRDVSRRARR